jgi:parallel beta-helix repeat protein
MRATSGGDVSHYASRRSRPHNRRRHSVEPLEARLLLATFTVSNTNNSGAGSLRQAITDANATTDADVIRFALPVSGGAVATIRPTSPLPAITAPLDIDGTTQSGYGPLGPVVELSGASAGANASGLVFTNASGSRVRGLTIDRWTAAGVRVTGGTAVVIESNYIGVTKEGFTAGNNTGVVIADASNCRVGGTTPAERNVISGNVTGVLIGRDSGAATPTADDNVVSGNYVGTNGAGNAAVPNTGAGIRVAGANNRTVIGGTAAGAGNLISGNTAEGVSILFISNLPGGQSPTAALGARIEGNTIGIDAIGFPLPNAVGVRIGIGGVVVGGTAAGARNVISGNTTGVRITGDAPRVEGNYIGLDATGATLGNDVGVLIESGGGAKIGSDQPGACNVISGNRAAGIRVVRPALVQVPAGGGHRIQGNYIGTTVAGTASLLNGGPGVELVKASDVLIGGDTAAAANLISGNTDGIRIDGAAGTSVLGNLIGTNPSGSGTFNTGVGVVILGGATNNTVSGNVFDRNGHGGINVLDGAGNALLSNSFRANGGLGIDLGGDGFTPNDPGDADTGPNERQNFPVITSVLNDGTSVFIRGTVEGRPAANAFRIQFFASPGQDGSTQGVAMTYLGEVTVDVGATGKGEFSATFPAVPAGRVITATATGKPSSALPPTFVQTSELSPAKAVPAADTTAPRVTGVSVKGTSWTAAFRRRLQETGAGSDEYGYSVPSGPGQTRPLPWNNLNEITIGFTEAADVQQDDLVVRGTNGDLAVTAFAVSGQYATWRLASPLGADRLTLQLRSGGVRDLVGRALDGEWSGGSSTFPSGNGTPGGDFLFSINVLPGDVNGNGSVLADDFSEVKRKFFKDTTDTSAGDASYTPFHDVDGSGSILAVDFSEVKKRFFTRLPATPVEASGVTRVADEVLA